MPFGLRLVLVFCSGVRCFLPFSCFLFILVRCLFSPLCSPVRPSPSGLGQLGCEVLRFGYWVSFPAASLSFQCPYPAPSFSPSSFRGFALSTAVACLHAIGALAPPHLFAAASFCLFGFGCRFSSCLSSSFCRALLLFFPCSFTTFLGFSALVLGRSLTSSVTLCFSFLLSVVLGLSHVVPFSTSFLSCQWFCVF